MSFICCLVEWNHNIVFACLSENLLKFFVDYHNSCWFIFWSTDWSIMRLNTAVLQHNKSKDNPACNKVPVICLCSSTLHLYSWLCMFVCCVFLLMCLTMKCCSGRRAGLCGGRALGARVKGWLSEALVQERTETWNIIIVTWLLNKHIFKLHLKIWFITYHEFLNENIFYYVTLSHLLFSIFDSPVYSHHVTVFVVVGFADFFCKNKTKNPWGQHNSIYIILKISIHLSLCVFKSRVIYFPNTTTCYHVTQVPLFHILTTEPSPWQLTPWTHYTALKVVRSLCCSH